MTTTQISQTDARPAIPAGGVLRIGTRSTVAVASIEEASAVYSTARDESGEGGSTFPDGQLAIDGQSYHVSYNGKVWRSKLAWKYESPVFNPYTVSQS